MKRGQIVEGIAESCDYPCRARVKCEEGVIAVKNVLPGQTVRVRVGRSHGERAEGTLLEVIQKSEFETGKVCTHFGECGGCAYLSLCPDEELRIKGEQIVRLLSSRVSESTLKYGREPVWDGIKDSPVKYGYRNKMEFSFGNDRIDGPLNVGLHKRGAFHDVLDVEDCMIVSADYRKIIALTRDFFRSEGTPFYRKKDHSGYLRNLLVRQAAHTGEILVCPVTASGQAAGFDDTDLMRRYAELLSETEFEGKLSGVVHIICDTLSDAIVADRTELLYGREYIGETLLDLNFRIGPFSFFQTNTHSAEVLYSLVREYVSMCGGGADGKTVFDLYSGTGTIAQIAARNASRVVGVEIIEEAVAAARRNASDNGLDNCEFICGDVLGVLDDLTDKPDIIILDPPRDGIHPKALPKIISYGVDYIVYISCKPTSLDRDLGPFLEAGYMISRYACVNQFPWTREIEAVMLLERVAGR